MGTETGEGVTVSGSNMGSAAADDGGWLEMAETIGLEPTCTRGGSALTFGEVTSNLSQPKTESDCMDGRARSTARPR